MIMVTEEEVRAMSADQRGFLYEQLRERLGISTWELQQRIGLGNNGRSQLRQWELHGTIPESPVYRERYFEALGIEVAR